MASARSSDQPGISTPPYNAFFYGTLLHPKVLERVIGNNGDHLKIAPALLQVCGLQQ